MLAGCQSGGAGSSAATAGVQASNQSASGSTDAASASGASSQTTSSEPAGTSSTASGNRPSGTKAETSGDGQASKPNGSGQGQSSGDAGKGAGNDLESNRLYPLSVLETAVLSANGKKFKVWVMDTASKGEEGMMYLKRKDIPVGHGMLFVMSAPGPQSFWMQNTYVPLDIIYLSDAGVVLNIQHGKPLDTTSLPSSGPSKYVLEFYPGDEAPYGLRPGVKVTIPPGISYKF